MQAKIGVSRQLNSRDEAKFLNQDNLKKQVFDDLFMSTTGKISQVV